MSDDKEFRYHVQRKSKAKPKWKNLTSETGMTRAGAEKFHKEITEDIKGSNRLQIEYRLHPVSRDELLDAREKGSGGHPSNDNSRPPYAPKPKESSSDRHSATTYYGRVFHKLGGQRKPVNDT